MANDPPSESGRYRPEGYSSSKGPRVSSTQTSGGTGAKLILHRGLLILSIHPCLRALTWLGSVPSPGGKPRVASEGCGIPSRGRPPPNGGLTQSVHGRHRSGSGQAPKGNEPIYIPPRRRTLIYRGACGLTRGDRTPALRLPIGETPLRHHAARRRPRTRREHAPTRHPP